MGEINILTGEMITGDLPAKAPALVQEWLADNKNELQEILTCLAMQYMNIENQIQYIFPCCQQHSGQRETYMFRGQEY